MDRRRALKTMILASGSLVALPSWAMGWKLKDVATSGTSFTMAEQEVITAIADTLIPSDGTIGALSVGVDKFLIRLIEECYEEEFQTGIKAQLENLNKTVKEKDNASFTECSKKQKEDRLRALSASKNEAEKEFFDFIKSQTIRGFNTSEEVMVNYHNYVMMPGYYDGCVDVEN